MVFVRKASTELMIFHAARARDKSAKAPHALGPFTMRVRTLAMESRNVFNLQDFEQNEIPLKQRSFEGSIDKFLAYLMLICC